MRKQIFLKKYLNFRNWWGSITFKFELSLAKLRWLFFPMKTANMAREMAVALLQAIHIDLFGRNLVSKDLYPTFRFWQVPCDQTYLECSFSTLTKVDVAKICYLLKRFCHWLWEQFSHLDIPLNFNKKYNANSLPELSHNKTKGWKTSKSQNFVKFIYGW